MAQTIIAPDINWPDMKWVNYDRAISLGELRGKIVILYFWTAGSVQCHHLFPALRRLEQQHSEEIAIIGIHTPKFSAERSPETVLAAIARHDVRHPIVHDPDRLIWRLYAVKTWPTIVFVGADGRLLGQVANEPDTESLVQAVSQLIQRAYKTGQVKLTPMPRASFVERDQRFRFPHKIITIEHDEATFALSDSGHHQIVLLDENGEDVRRYGTGERGFRDGDAGQAQFNRPTGIFWHRGSIYVADTGNHAVRRLDIENDIVTTTIGNGKRGGYLGAPVQATSVSLASPQDVAISGGSLFFANTGTHQIGRYDFGANACAVLVGNGAEAIVDGPPLNASLARPSALVPSENGERLYFVDAETSAVRTVSLKADLRVSTLIGNGPHDFGHVNGPFLRARMQQPLGLALHRGNLLVADSYNNTLRELDLDQQMVRDFIGMGYKNMDHRPMELSEPTSVVSIDQQTVYCVDRNNHRIVVFEPRMKAIRTWQS